MKSPILFLLVMCATISGKAQQFRIDRVEMTPPGEMRISFQGSPVHYFILEQSDFLSDFHSEQAILGQAGVMLFSAQPSAFGSRFFKVRKQPIAQPLDLDEDGIDDAYELRNAPALNPFNAADASQDDDGDEIENLEEYLNGWSILSKSSPTPVEFSRAPGGQNLVSAVFDSGVLGEGFARANAAASPSLNSIPNLIRILPEVSVNSHGTMAYIAELQGPNGTTNRQIFVSRRLGDGAWQHSPVFTDAQATGVARVGPGLQINDANVIVVRRAFQDNSPLGVITTTFMEIWNANVRGQYETVAVAEPLNTFAEFQLIDSRAAINNRGSVVFFAQDRNTRYIVSRTATGAAKTPLSATTPYTPVAVSDADTVVLRVGDETTGSIRIFGMPDIGNRQISRIASSANGFSNLGLRPGLSDDGRVVAFYAHYTGATDGNIGSTGPGIFALVHPVVINAQTVSAARLVRVAGIANNGQLDPGETWNDGNTNGIVELGEDEGSIVGFIPDQAIGISRAGVVTFTAQTSPGQAGSLASLQLGLSIGIVGFKLKNYEIPAPAPTTLVISTDDPFSGGLTPDTFTLHDPLAGSSAPYCAFSATESGSGRSLPLLAIVAFPELEVIDKNTVTDAVPYAANAPSTPQQNKELCLRADPATEVGKIFIELSNLTDPALLAQLAWKLVELPSGTELEVGNFFLPSPGVDLTLHEGANVADEKYFEIQAGKIAGINFTIEQRLKVRLVRDRLNWWFEPFSTDFGWRTARPEKRVVTGDYIPPQRTTFKRESLQSIYEFLKQNAPAAPASFGGPAGQAKSSSWLDSSITCFGEFHDALKAIHSNPLIDLNSIPRLELRNLIEIGGSADLPKVQKFMVEKQTRVTVDGNPLFSINRAPQKAQWAQSAASEIADPRLEWYDLLAFWQKEGSLNTSGVEELGGIWTADSMWSDFGAAPPTSLDQARLLYACEIAYIGFGLDALFPHSGPATDNYPDLSDYTRARSHFVTTADRLLGAGSGNAALASIQMTETSPQRYEVTFDKAFYIWMLKLVGGLILADYWEPEGIGATYAAYNSGRANVALMRASLGSPAYPERGRLGFNNWAWQYEVRVHEFAEPPPNSGIRPNAIRFLFYRDVFKALVSP